LQRAGRIRYHAPVIRFLRQRAIENPWILRTLFGIIIAIFIVTMGWFGGAPSTDRVVATVGGVEIPMSEYDTAYRRTYEAYQNIFKDQFTPELIKQLDLKRTVLNNLIDLQVWRLTAKELGLSVTDEELTAALVKIPAFQRNGHFDPVLYEQTLLRNHWTPRRFEDAQRLELLADKARAAVRASVALLPEDQPPAPPPPPAGEQPPPPVQAREAVRQQKEERALMAVLQNLRERTLMTINEQLL
jgi:hypothetical protein